MFDFERLDVYQKIRRLNKELMPRIAAWKAADPVLGDQMQRAAMSIALNLAEGAGRYTNADKKRFYTMARSSVFEAVALLHLLKDTDRITSGEYAQYYEQYEEISKMLLGVLRNVPANDRLTLRREEDI